MRFCPALFISATASGVATYLYFYFPPGLEASARLFLESSSLRFGLPCSEREWQRLDLALTQLKEIESVEVNA